MKKKIKTCSRCILTSTIPNVNIMEDGLCSECHGYFSNKKNKDGYDIKLYTTRMKKIFSEVKRKKQKYDILVGFSGGKDSAYLLYLLKNKYKLRPLAVSIIHPLVNKTSLINMELVAEKIDFNLIKFFVNSTLYKKYIKEGLTEANKINLGPHSACRLCNYFKDTVLNNLAETMGIPLLSYGTDSAQFPKPMILQGIEKKEFYKYHIKPLNQIFNKIFGNKYKNTLYDINEKQFCKKNSPIIIYPFTFLKEYTPEKALNMLKKIGIERDKMNPEKTNCDAIHLFNYLSYKKYSCHSQIFTYANAIRKISYNNQAKGKKAKRKIANYFAAYEKLLYYLIKKNGQKTIKDKETKKIFKIFPKFKKMKYKNLILMIEGISKIKYYSKYFNIKL